MRSFRATSFACLAAILMLPGLAAAAVSAFPGNALLPSDGGSVTYRYRFTGVQTGTGAPFTGTLVSPTGFLVGPGVDIATAVAPSLSARIVNGAGEASETVFFPRAPLAALSPADYRNMSYARQFGDGGSGAAEGVAVPLTITGPGGSDAGGALVVKRLELFFENRRGEITVKRNRRGLKAFADIRYGGSGLLSGYWEVDGRRILDVDRTLSFGASVTLETPEIPDLPTFDPGVHAIRFVVRSPALPFDTPKAVYFVTPGEENARHVTIAVPHADPAAAPSGGAHRFVWDRPSGIARFFLEFSEEPGGKPLFSAFTTEPAYTMPKALPDSPFTVGRRYYWRVLGYDANDNPVGESTPVPFVY